MPTTNEKIQYERVQLITHEGENVGVVPTSTALSMARAANLDLVLIAEHGKEDVPVVKIMDVGKVLYERKKQQADAKKHQKVIQVKEVKINPNIGEHDYQIKLKQAVQFLQEGKRVKITLFFRRGRESMLKMKRGSEIFGKIQKTLEEQGVLKNVIQEDDANTSQVWSRIYYIKKS